MGCAPRARSHSIYFVKIARALAPSRIIIYAQTKQRARLNDDTRLMVTFRPRARPSWREKRRQKLFFHSVYTEVPTASGEKKKPKKTELSLLLKSFLLNESISVYLRTAAAAAAAAKHYIIIIVHKPTPEPKFDRAKRYAPIKPPSPPDRSPYILYTAVVLT